jgi:hypothetical protein
MSFNYGYNPKVLHPNTPNTSIIQMRSGEYQTPFFFGGSQVPTDLHLPQKIYDGSYSSDMVPSSSRPYGRGIKVYIPKQKYYVK